MDGDEEILDRLHEFVKTLPANRIIVYCWNPECDRAEYLKAILLDESGYYGSFNENFNESNILIYEEGWDEWNLLSNPN